MGKPPYADVVTSLGWNGLCCDTWVFGERATCTELHVFKDMLSKGPMLWGMMVYDSLRAMDYLVTRPDVDATRISTLGMSMGARLVVSRCLTDFQVLIEENTWRATACTTTCRSC